MFNSEERDRLRFDLLEYAAKDQRISGAAITGSAAAEREDRWSDIDLAFGVSDAADSISCNFLNTLRGRSRLRPAAEPRERP